MCVCVYMRYYFGLMGRVFAMLQEAEIQSQVKSYQ